jgi:hypothetical protein
MMHSRANILQLVVQNDNERTPSRTFTLSYICSDGEDTDLILLLADVFDSTEIQVWETDRRNMRFTAPLSTADFIMDHMYTQRYRDIHCTYTNEINKEIIFHHKPTFEADRPPPTLPNPKNNHDAQEEEDEIVLRSVVLTPHGQCWEHFVDTLCNEGYLDDLIVQVPQ